MRLCFVVHRYAPYPGGSEYYVQQMAEESARRGHDVTVLAGTHKGSRNGVRVTRDPACLFNQDLVIIHGGDVSIQNQVLSNINKINSKVLYLLIKPSDSSVCVQGLMDAKYIGCSTLEDYEHVKKYNVLYKARRVSHGICPISSEGKKNIFRQQYNIPREKKMFISCGGYWSNKRMKELAGIFNNLKMKDTILVTTGYDNSNSLMPKETEYVYPLMIDDPGDVKNAIVDADAYIMHSSSEGFGLVILEAMLNKTPWISKNLAAARMLRDFGRVYDEDDELYDIITNFQRNDSQIVEAYKYVISNHLIEHTVNDIEYILNYS